MTAIDEKFVTLLTTRDPIRADSLQALLEADGIPALLPGRVTGATLHLQPASKIHLQVPESQLERAREIVAAIEDSNGELLEPTGETAIPLERRRFTASAAAIMLTFGTGHFYAREQWSGFILLLAELSALLTAFRSGEVAWLLAVAPIVLIDLVGSLIAVGRFERGRALSTLDQVLRTGGLVFFLFLVAGFLGPHLSRFLANL